MQRVSKLRRSEIPEDSISSTSSFPSPGIIISRMNQNSSNFSHSVELAPRTQQMEEQTESANRQIEANGDNEYVS